MERLYDSFLAVLGERYPNKPDLVNALMDLLHLEKESIYRRLRRDVYFSAEEMLRIAGAWDISLDGVVSANREKVFPFSFKTVDYVDLSEEDYAILEQHNRDIETVARDPAGMAIEVLNSLPRGLYSRSEPLTRFFTMKWRHKHSPHGAIPFSDIVVPERMREIDRELIVREHAIPEMHSIHDRRMIENLVCEIVYFRSIGMLTADDTALLRDELLALVNYLESVTASGRFPSSGNRMFFYLSHTWIGTEYQIYRSSSLNLAMVRVLERQYVGSTDRTVVDNFMRMALATRGMSVLMSGSNTLQQAEFFVRQREIVSSL
jgi:hypothetical protein